MGSSIVFAGVSLIVFIFVLGIMFLVGQWVIGELQATGAESQYYYALNQCITEERTEAFHLAPGAPIPFADVDTHTGQCASREYCGGDSSCPDGDRCPDKDVVACRVVVLNYSTVNTDLHGWVGAVTTTDSTIHVCEETSDGHCNQWGWQVYGWPDDWSNPANQGNACTFEHSRMEVGALRSWNAAHDAINEPFDIEDIFGPYDAYGKFGPLADTEKGGVKTLLSTHCLQSIEFYKQYLQVDYMIKMTVMLGLAGIITVLIIRLLMSTTALGRS